jgi:branched-chain amino acid aminotransferase
MQIDCDYSDSEYMDAILKSLRANRIRGDAHVRLTVFVTGEGAADARGPVSVICTVKAKPSSPLQARVVNAAISTWRRIDDPKMSPRAKAEANYHNTHFGLLEVFRNGYDQAIFLSEAGKVSGGGHASFLMVRNGVLITPPVPAGGFMGVTRATLTELAVNELGLRIQEREIERSELLLADETLLCGSGQEIRPVISINKALINSGDIGPVTRRLWDAYQGAVRGWNRNRSAWLTRVAQNSDRQITSIRTGEVGPLLERGYLFGESSI